jgi:leader peptidase (prepilin peptidase)/N-methyltransferase
MGFFMTVFLMLIAIVYGLILGSFLNAWAWRLAHDESIMRGRSHCAACGAQIRAYDNVPVVSWVVLGGKCRDCGEPISWRYPVGEAATAALFAAVAAYDGVSWLLIPHLLFVSAMVLVTQVDLEIQIIPDVVVLPVAAVGVPLMLWLGEGPWWEYPAAGLGAAGFLWGVAWLYEKVRGLEGMGLGDVKMALCMGIYLGIAVVPALFIGFVSGAIIGVAIMGMTGKDAKTAVPFGPFLAAGAIVALFFGQDLIDLYVGFALR